MRVISGTTIEQPVLDNQNYGYYVNLYLTYDSPHLDVQFYGAVIEYTYTSP